MNINKSDLVNIVADRASRPKYVVRDIIDEVFSAISAELEGGNRVSIRGFGTFETKNVKGHPAVHPVTGERLQVQDYINVAFRPGEELIRGVREDKDITQK